MTLYEITWFFVIYSFLGWCLEVIYHAVKKGQVINRGFLCGPVCPVYGFGVLAVFTLFKGVIPALTGLPSDSFSRGDSLGKVMIVFLCGVLLATLVELAAGWLLDIAFHARWWDYSNEPLNFHGYICLRFSLLWGAAIVFVVMILQPLIENSLIILIPGQIGWPLLALIYITYLADFIVTVSIVVGLNRHLEELDHIQENMKIVSNHLSRQIGGRTIRTQQSLDESRVQLALAGYEARDEREKKQKEMAARAEALKTRIMEHPLFGSRRILDAFPNMRHRRYGDALSGIQKRLRR